MTKTKRATIFDGNVVIVDITALHKAIKQKNKQIKYLFGGIIVFPMFTRHEKLDLL